MGGVGIYKEGGGVNQHLLGGKEKEENNAWPRNIGRRGGHHKKRGGFILKKKTTQTKFGWGERFGQTKKQGGGGPKW